MPITPDLAELIREALISRLADVHVALPGKVTKYDAAKQVVDVEPGIKRTVPDADGNPVDEALPILPCVPVAWPRGGGFFVHLPLAAGDTGLIVFAERSLDTWRAKGQVTSASDRRTHGLSGAVFLPGLSPASSVIADASADDLTLGHDGGALVRIKPDGTVEIGADGATFDYAAHAAKVDSRLATLQAAHDGHVHVTTATIGASATVGVLSPTAAPVGPLDSVAAAKVKVE